MVEKKKKKSEITKAYIYEGAIKLFTKQGFDKTTMRDLASSLDMSLGNIYYHFKNKDDILIHYFRILQDETVSGVTDSLESKLSKQNKIKKIIQTNMDLLKKNSSITKELIKSTSGLSHPLSPFGDELRDCQMGAIELFRRALSEDQKKSEYLDSLAFLYWLYYLGLCLFWANDDSDQSAMTEKLYGLSFPLTYKLVGLTRIGVGKKLLIQISKTMRSILMK